MIAQDEADTWTTHANLKLDVDSDKMGSEETVYATLGGNGAPAKLDIDEVLVRSTYRANLVVARHFMGPKRRIFLAGDSAHQNIPTGGYGMNMGLADAFSIAAKLAGVIQGYGGRYLLDSYEQERRAVSLLSVEHSGVHLKAHQMLEDVVADGGEYLDDDSEQGDAIRKKIHDHYQTHDGENKCFGIEMGYTYKSAVVLAEEPSAGPKFNPRSYIPSTVPGHRAPHVFLNDGTPLFDLYGKHYSLVDFTGGAAASGVDHLLTAAKRRGVPLEHIKLAGEATARKLWERDLVLVRPDGHVSWRGDSVSDASTAVHIVEVAVGVKGIESGLPVDSNENDILTPFSGTAKVIVQTPEFNLEKKGLFQQ